MFIGIIIIVIGAVNVLIGAFTDWHYEWFTTRLQREMWGKTATRITSVIAGVVTIVVGIFFIIEHV